MSGSRPLGAVAVFAFLLFTLLAAPASAQIVISQVYGAGGNSGATYTNDFVELFNSGDDPVSLDGKQIAYTSSAGDSWNGQRTPLPATTLQPGQYFLIQLAGGSNGVALPTPDATGNTNMSGTNGKVALFDDVDPIAAEACPAGERVLDLVGFGTANCPAPTPSLAGAAAARNNGGCANTGVNSADFTIQAPAPRNSTTTANPCTPVGTDIEAAIADASVEEGHSGFTDLVFTVTLSEAAPAGGIAFTASTTAVTAEAPSDFTALVDAPFTVAEGEITGTVTVQIVGDTAIEEDETFTVTIATEVEGVVISQATATGTIINDDHPVVIPTELHISQVYGGGGNAGAVYTHDFVELFNAGSAPVSLSGLTLRYASAAGNFPNSGVGNYLELPAVSIPAGGYYLVQLASGSGNGVALPAPDASGGANLSGTAGKLVLVATTGDFACGSVDVPCSTEQVALVVDLVGYGSVSWFEGTGAAPTLSNTTAGLRNGSGCIDSDNNAADFTSGTPAARNSAWPVFDCQGGSEDLIVSIASASVAEGDDGLTDLAFNVTMSGPAPAGGVAITATTADGTAQAPGDYLALTEAPFTIAEGETSGSVIVQIVGDTEVEQNETFTVTIATSQAGVVVGNATATGTILNDDVPGTMPTGLVISQVYGGGGNSGAPFTHDFVELFNAGSAPVELAGTQIAYTSATGNQWNNRTILPAATLQPGQYFLVQQGAGAGNGVALPQPDVTGEILMGAMSGKIALIFGTEQIPNDVCPTGENILDLVGWGTANCPASPVGTLSNSTAALRNGNGCDNTGVNGDDFSIDAPAPRNTATTLAPCAGTGKPDLVISQVYGGGGNSGATLTHDFVELFNAGSAPAELDGLTLRYGSATNAFPNSGDNNYFALPAATIPAGGYYLVQMAQGAGGSQPLPTPDAVGAAAMAAANGKIVLVASTGDFACGSAAVPCSPEQLALIVDLVGFGTANLYEGSGAVPALSNTTAALRNDDGCVDTDDNAADFTVGAPAPRNSAAPANLCGGTGPDPDPVLAIGNASVAEGDSGLTDLVFNVTLSLPAPAGGVAGTATTADGTAQAPGDYLALVDAPFTIAEGETTATITVQIVGDTEQEPDETFTVTIATSTPDIVLGNATATGTIVNDDLDTLEIYQIQGSGLRSPFAPATGNDLGQQVRTDGNVVTAVASNGFFMQTPDARDDNDPATSNGIFVFTGSAPSVVVGNNVDVLGRVQEYFDWTQLTGATVTVTGTGDLPTPVVLDETTPSPDLLALSCPLTDSNFECLENMRVHVPAGAVVQGNQRYAADLFGEAFVTASGERARREKGLLPNATPPVAGLPVWDGNPEVFELDADGAGAVPTGTPLFGGDLFEATGVIAYQFGNYALRPTELTVVEAEIPRPVPESSGDAELRVGSLNTLNLCQGGCDPVKLARIADYIGTVLGNPDVIGLQEVVGAGSATALATVLNSTFGTDYVGYIGSTAFSDGIRNAFLVRPSRVEVIRTRELDAHLMINQCSGTPPCVLHDRPPHLLDARFIGGDSERFSVLNNHTRSLIGIGDAGAAGDRVRFKRFEQGKSLATLIQRFQDGEELQPGSPIGDTATADVPLLLVGDYNAFEVTDGYVDVVGLIAGSYDNAENEYQLEGGNIVDPPLRVLVNDVPVEDRYSYTFREDLGNTLAEAPRNVGSVQVLDHGFANEAALPWCSGMVFGRGNADAPAELRNTGTDAVASSDHDGFIIRLSTDRLFRHDFEEVAACRP